MRPSYIFLVPMAALLACGKGDPDAAGTPGSDDPDGDDAVVLPGDQDLSWMDALPPGMQDPPENAHGGLQLRFNRELSDAVTAYAACGAWLSGCLNVEQGDFDACVARFPVCQTQTPWEEGACCPADCQAQYDGLRAEGMGAFDAYATTFSLDRSCFVGLPGEMPTGCAR